MKEEENPRKTVVHIVVNAKEEEEEEKQMIFLFAYPLSNMQTVSQGTDEI